MLSQYISCPDWEAPCENLLDNLTKAFGQKAKLEKIFAEYSQIQGFDSKWSRPRDSRQSLSLGSVLQISFDKAVDFPESLILGSGQREGYGRILCNPSFLREIKPAIGPAMFMEKCECANIDGHEPMLELLRQRALNRLAETEAARLLQIKEWQNFLESVAKLTQPTANQRANLVRMSLSDFKKMLDKSPGEQWKIAICVCPFHKRPEHLADTAILLLDKDSFFGSFSVKIGKLPGGKPGSAEENEFKDLVHQLFIRKLVSTWGKLARIDARRK